MATNNKQFPIITLQRYFPEFFPSCYTERRLNLKRLFSEVGCRAEDAELVSITAEEEAQLLRDAGVPESRRARRL